MKIVLAKATKTFLGVEDHGLFVAGIDLDLDDGGSITACSNWGLDQPKRDNDKFIGRFGTAEGMDFIKKLIQVFGAESWEKIPGKVIWALFNDDATWGPVVGFQSLGFLRKERKEFIFKEHFDKLSVSS